ncbi:MAG: hypothetical protein PHC34_00085 [Candidatus Gastranaerophilales bacterium]|nr:hypothetical protein [Candidatus Gastranaerophilales bacterium]
MIGEYMSALSPANNLFLREVSEKKLKKLSELAYQNPKPLYSAIKYGYFNIIRKKALDFLEIEKQKAEYNDARQNFENAIYILESKDTYRFPEPV